MSFAKDEILDIKKSKKEISIENFDKTESIPSNKFSLTTKALTIQNPKNYKSNIESVKENGKYNIKKEDMKDYYKNKEKDLEEYRKTWTKKEQLFETTYKHDILSKVNK